MIKSNKATSFCNQRRIRIAFEKKIQERCGHTILSYLPTTYSPHKVNFTLSLSLRQFKTLFHLRRPPILIRFAIKVFAFHERCLSKHYTSCLRIGFIAIVLIQTVLATCSGSLFSFIFTLLFPLSVDWIFFSFQSKTYAAFRPIEPFKFFGAS